MFGTIIAYQNGSLTLAFNLSETIIGLVFRVFYWNLIDYLEWIKHHNYTTASSYYGRYECKICQNHRHGQISEIGHMTYCLWNGKKKKTKKKTQFSSLWKLSALKSKTNILFDAAMTANVTIFLSCKETPDLIAIIGLYLCIDHQKVLLTIFSWEKKSGILRQTVFIRK